MSNHRPSAASAAATRRQMLRRLGLAATAVYAAPALLNLAPARATSASFSSASGRRRGARRRRRAAPEFVLAVPTPADLERVTAAGYRVVASGRVGLIQSELARVRSRRGRTLAQARAEITSLVPAALFDLNHLYRPNALTCHADGCTAFELIGWTQRPADCGLSPSIGMIDTAVDTAHPALRGGRLEVVGTVSGDRRPSSRVHGTAVAALLIGRPDARTPGLLPRARLVAVDAFHADGRGDATDAFDLVRAIDTLVARNVSVMNMSFAGPANMLLEHTVASASARGVALVAAAGNGGPHASPLYPAAYRSVLAVTAVDRNSRVYRQAARGRHISFAAPGVRLWTADGRDGRLRSGTSYAAPFVTAAVAAGLAAAPNRPLADILAQLAEDAVDLGPAGRDNTFGWGLVRVDIECPVAR